MDLTGADAAPHQLKPMATCPGSLRPPPSVCLPVQSRLPGRPGRVRRVTFATPAAQNRPGGNQWVASDGRQLARDVTAAAAASLIVSARWAAAAIVQRCR